MDLGTVQSGRTMATPDPAPVPVPTQSQREIAMEDSEILRRLVRLLSKSEEDELFAQDANRQPSSSALHSRTFHRSKSEGDSTSVHMDRSRSVIRLVDTAPLRISRPPKVELMETYKEFERSSSKLRSKLSRLQRVVRESDRDSVKSISKAATKMIVHLEHVTNYMKQQVELLAQADIGPPSEVHAQNLSSALSGVAQSARVLGDSLDGLRDEGMLEDVEDLDALEGLAQLAESEARTLKDGREDESLKRISGIRFRQHSAELNTQFAKTCDEVAAGISCAIKSIMPSIRGRSDRESQQHLVRMGIAILFSVVTAMMLSTFVDGFQGGSETLVLATSGIWLVSLACSVASGITGIVHLVFSGDALRGMHEVNGRVSKWLAKGAEVLFLLAATLFSVGLCVFAFASSQAAAARAIVIAFTSLHFLGLFLLFFWHCRFPGSNRPDSDGRQNRDKTGGSMWKNLWNVAHLSIRPSVNPSGPIREASTKTAKGRRSTRGSRGIGDVDVEQGLHRSGAKVYRRSVPPIIRITDTDREVPSTTATPGYDTNGADADTTHARNSHVRTSGHQSPTGNVLRISNPDVNLDDEASSSDSGGDNESKGGSDRTSLSFSHTHTQPHVVLAVPSAQRLSSDSSRSLPALPPDVQVVRCMAYSLNGMFLCVGNASPQERCTIFSSDSPAITLGELKVTDVVRQIEWSMDGENILLRLTHMIYVWNAMPQNGTRRPAIIIYQESDNMKWINSDSFISAKKDVLTSFRIDGIPTGVFQIPSSSVQDFVVTNDGQRIICLVSNFASTRSGTTGNSTQKLIVYNLEHKAVEQIAPVGRDAMSLVRSTVLPDLVLVNFAENTPPQIWRYRENTDAEERRTSAAFLSFKRAMSFKAPAGRFAGYGIFGSAEDKLVLSLGEDGDMFIFAADTGQPLRHVTTAGSTSRKSQSGTEADIGVGIGIGARRSRPLAQCVAWDPDILTFTVCMGYADGSIWQWKIPFDAIGQDASRLSTATSTFGVTSLGDEDSTLIRPADVKEVVREPSTDA